MSAGKQRGDYGEQLAMRHLEARGYRLLAKNWRFLRKELDLVMQKGETVVFFEVKARSGSGYGTPGESVTARKQRNLLLAAQAYLAEHGLTDAPARFDVIEVYLQRGEVRHIENAFGQ